MAIGIPSSRPNGYSGVVWKPTETSLESTKEATDSTPCGIDLRLLTEVALLPPDPVSTYDLSSYWEELMLSLALARKLVVTNTWEVQSAMRASMTREWK